ncbi:trithorax group protein osa-like isoform X2 [Homarus americanus]|uniref:trithorax group protein osa-like isoform X2 n=1 Tax=Homarus americanus TaxID=6706 RepID=UPI001C445B8A|nr:trithorax group protein osa-like isoform X2 [Homarus americanus]
MKETGSAASLKAAQEAAAKVNAMLVASGQLKLSELHKSRTKNNKSNDLFIEEVVINEAPMSARNFLTRSSTQEEISKMSGAAVSTRGRYMNPEELKNPSKNSGDRPLYLHIQAVNQQDVKVAVGRIMHIIMEHSHRKGHNMQRPRGPRPNPAPGLMGPRPSSGPRAPRPMVFRPPRPDMSAPPPQTQPPPPLSNIFREKVFLPVNIGLNPTDIRARLLGDSGMNLRYIQEETGVAISIRGIGSGYHEHGTGQEAQDSLHFYLEHDNQDQFNQAKDLVVNLAQTVIAEVQQELQQQQQQHQQQQQQQQHQQQMQQPAPLFSQPPPQQPDVTGGGMGQPHMTPVQVAPHQLNVPPAPPPQMVHSQMVPPQVPPHSQMVPPHVGHPQMAAAQVPIQGQVGGPQVNASVMHTVLAPHLQPGGAAVSQEVMSQQEVIQATVVSLPQQVVHLTAPPVVSSAAAVANQQLVHTSSGTQLVTLPPGTQIINTPEGPRLVALATGTQVAAPVAPVPANHQAHPNPMHDPQGVPNPMVQQQQAPQSLSVSVGNNHIALNQTPILSDTIAPPSSMARSMGLSNSYPTPSISNTISTSSSLTSVAPHCPPESSFPPNVNASIPPPNTSMGLGVPPPAAGLGLPPAVTAHAGTVSFVLTPGVNTMTTTSGVGLLVPQDPNVASGQMHMTQPVVVTGVLPTSQQQQHQPQHPHQVSQAGAHSSYLGPVPAQSLAPGYSVSQPSVEQPVSSAYLPSDQANHGYSHAGPPITSASSHHYAQVQPQQQRPIGVGFAPVGMTVGGEGGPPTRMDYPGPGVMPGHLSVNHLQPRHQGQKPDQQQLHPPGNYYTNRPNHQEHRPVSLEQQWQQFQQQVKMEGGQQQYDPYSATDEGEHQDAGRQPQQQPPTSQSQSQQQSSQLPVQQPPQPYGNFGDQPNQQQQQPQQPADTREGENRSPGSLMKVESKPTGGASPHNSYTYYYSGQHGSGGPGQRTGPPSPERPEHLTQQAQNDHRYQAQQGNNHSEVPQSSPNQQQRGSSPQGQNTQGQTQPGQPQQQFHQGQYQGQLHLQQDQSSQKNPEGGLQEEQYQTNKPVEVQTTMYQQVGHQPTPYQQGPPQEGLSKLVATSDPHYLPGAPQHNPSQQGPIHQGPPQQMPPQQVLPQQGLPDGQYPQGPPPLQQPQQNQQYPPGQYPPGGQYPWAQYPQPNNGLGPFPTGPATFGNGHGPYPNGPGPFNGPGGPSVSTPYTPLGPGGSGPYQSGTNGQSPYPAGPNGPGAINSYPSGPSPADDRQSILQDKKAEPGVARDMTASLLMPPPPPPPPAEALQGAGGTARGREETPEPGMKRQRSCSPQDERKAARRSSGDADDSAAHEGNGAARPSGPDPAGPEGSCGPFSGHGNFQGGPGSFPGGGANFSGAPGGFPSGPGSYMGPGGPWGWGPMPGPYSGLPIGPNPFNRPPGSGMANPQTPYNRSLRDRPDGEDGGGGSRRGGRGGGGRGGFSMGGRGGRDRRW